MSKKSKKVEKKRGHFSASFAVRLWVEIDEIDAENMEQALAEAKKIATADLVDMNAGVTVLDSYTDVVQVCDMETLNKVGA